MIKQTATSNESLTDLSIIGVPVAFHSRMPGVGGYPKRFAPEAFKVWKKLVESTEFKTKCKTLSLDLAWHTSIIDFLMMCEETGVFPFPNNTDTTRSDFIADFVRRGRIEIVKFFDECEFFKKVKIKKAYREYKRKDTGLTITSWADLQPIKDPGFEKWLNRSPFPRFLKAPDLRWTKIIRPNVVVWVRFVNTNRVTVGFTIDVAGTITIPGKKTPKRKEVDKYIDNNIFLPVVRSHRLSDIKTRLF